jgi:hypothetical protein
VSEVLSDIALWMFVVYSGIAFGAGLYELRVNVPRWFTPKRGSARSVNVDAITADDSGRRFWIYTTTAPLTLLTVVSCVIAWNPATARERWWLAGAAVMLVERVGTLGYFIPTLLKLLQPDRLSQKKAEDAARHWVRLNHIRSVFAFAGWLAALRALSL